MNRIEAVCMQGFDAKTRREDTTRTLKNIKVDPREIEWGGMDWIQLAQDRDQWRAPVNTMMNLWVP
jgi:hypothetical protein